MENAFRQPLFVVGMSLSAVGLATSMPGIWIPGCVFMVIGFTNRKKG